jgi:hypothetical protein
LQSPQPRKYLTRLLAQRGYVTQANELLNALRGGIIGGRFEGDVISVNIGQDGNLHSR